MQEKPRQLSDITLRETLEILDALRGRFPGFMLKPDIPLPDSVLKNCKRGYDTFELQNQIIRSKKP